MIDANDTFMSSQKPERMHDRRIAGVQDTHDQERFIEIRIFLACKLRIHGYLLLLTRYRF